MKKYAAVIITLALLSPIGLLAKGTAFGEWSAAELKQKLGYVPHGLVRLESIWSAPLAGYNLSGWNNGLLQAVGYIISALVGIGLIFIIFKVISLAIGEGDRHDA